MIPESMEYLEVGDTFFSKWSKSTRYVIVNMDDVDITYTGFSTEGDEIIGSPFTNSYIALCDVIMHDITIKVIRRGQIWKRKSSGSQVKILDIHYDKYLKQDVIKYLYLTGSSTGTSYVKSNSLFKLEFMFESKSTISTVGILL